MKNPADDASYERYIFDYGRLIGLTLHIDELTKKAQDMATQLSVEYKRLKEEGYKVDNISINVIRWGGE